MSPYASAGVLVLCGALWGWAFTSSHINEYAVFRGQMTLTTFVMLKTFLTALTFSSLSFLVVSMVGGVVKQQQLDRLRASSNTRDGRGLLFVSLSQHTSYTRTPDPSESLCHLRLLIRLLSSL